MKRSRKEVSEEIEKLKTMKPKVRHMGTFGNDNHAAIDAQLDVLENDLTYDQIYKRYSAPPLDEEDEGEEDTHLVDAARDARAWLDDDTAESPSDSWSPLVKDE